MNGGIDHPSTETLVSALGDVTLKTPSGSVNVPLRPVISSIRAVSRLWPSASPAPAWPRANAAMAANVNGLLALISTLLVFG